MSQFDRDKWNDRYATNKRTSAELSSEVIITALPHLKESGKAIDVAGGTGRNSLQILAAGYDVTVADISRVGLKIAVQEYAKIGVDLKTLEIDFEEEPFPPGPWDVILQVCFLDRNLFPQFAPALSPGGLLIIAQPTLKNLEQHEKPPRDFLLEEGELEYAFPELETVHYSEGWRVNKRHEAHLIARQLYEFE